MRAGPHGPRGHYSGPPRVLRAGPTGHALIVTPNLNGLKD